MIDIQQLANALLSESVYIARSSDDAPFGLPGALGATSRSLDVVLMPWLRSRGEWAGRKPAIFIDDVAIKKLIEDENGDEQLHDQILAAVLTHEVGHIAESSPDLTEPTEERCGSAMAALAFSLDAVVDGTVFSFSPFWSHGERFIRGAIHLAYRAAALGCAFPVEFLFFEAYHLPSACEFQHALGREPQYLASVPIRDIHTFQPTGEFIRLWQRCLTDWHKSNGDE
jgi:hypothetical protein